MAGERPKSINKMVHVGSPRVLNSGKIEQPQTGHWELAPAGGFDWVTNSRVKEGLH
jgi:hypothetical protein